MVITRTSSGTRLTYTGADGMSYMMDVYGDISDEEMVTDALNHASDIKTHEEAWSNKRSSSR